MSDNVVIVNVEGGETIKFLSGSPSSLVLGNLSKDPRAGSGTLANKDNIQVLATEGVLTSVGNNYVFRRQFIAIVSICYPLRIPIRYEGPKGQIPRWD